ncbi:hypothetical protein GCM10027064_25070 [Microbacterium petrolearium]
MDRSGVGGPRQDRRVADGEPTRIARALTAVGCAGCALVAAALVLVPALMFIVGGIGGLFR